LKKFDELTTLKITHAVLEIHKGDRLRRLQQASPRITNRIRRKKDISAKVISIYGGVVQAGQNAVVTLNKGRRGRFGERGMCWRCIRQVRSFVTVACLSETLFCPDVRYGLVFVFRVFDKVSYAVVLETRLPVQVLDRASTPE